MALYTKVKGDVNYTTVGSPTISNGIASGFSSSNYLKLNSNIDFSKTLEYKFRFTTGSVVNTEQVIFWRGDSTYGLGYTTHPNGNYSYLYYRNSSSNTYKAANFKIQPNTTYDILIKSSNGIIKWWLGEPNNLIEQTSINFDFTNISGVGPNIGYGINTNCYFTGTIDLNNSYINVDSKAWFGSSLSKVKIRNGSDGYTIVGSPIISQGIMTNLSPSDYITTKLSYTNIGSFEINIKCKLPSDFESKMPIVVSYGNKLILGLNSGRKIYALFNNGAQGITGTTTLSLSGTYYLRYTLDENKVAKVYVSTDGKTYTLEGSVTLNDTNYNAVYTNSGKLQIGTWSYGHSYSSVDTIYLNQSNIIINNKMIWNGIHQDITSWKIHQDNFSKYYTIVDGKLTWANPNIWLKSDGNSWIDTGYTANNTTGIKVTLNVPPTGGEKIPMGSSNGSGTNSRYYLDVSSNGSTRTTLYYGFNTYTSSSADNVVNTKCTLTNNFYNDRKFFFNSVQKGSIDTQLVEQTKTIAIFKYNNASGSVYPFDDKIYLAQITQEQTLVRHFVPVPKGLLIGNFIVPSNGMFDIIEQKFYPNAGTGEFTIGGIPEDYIIEGGKLIWCNPNIYLESSGTQRIDTGITRTIDKKWEFIGKFNYSNVTTRQLNGAQGYVYVGVVNGYLQINNASEAHENITAVSNTNYEFDIVFDCPNNSLNYKVGNTTSSRSATYTNSPSGAHFHLFGLNDNVLPSSCKISYWGLYENNIIMRYFVPVPKGMLIGNKIASSNCMFDLVTQTFFENQGTGTFVIGGLSGDYINIGDNIVWVDENVYLKKSSGLLYFDSGIIPTEKTEIEFTYKQKQLNETTRLFGFWNNGTLGSYSVNGPSLYGGVDSGHNHYTNFNVTRVITANESSMSGNIKHTITLKNNKAYFDGVFQNNLGNSTSFKSLGTMFVGNVNINPGGIGTISNEGDFIYSWKCWNDGELLQCFFPVNTNTTIGSFTVPSPGMWDAVTKKFYPNKGTGTFTYGKDS